jgi:uncharacterized protein (DUF1778 family)
VNIFQVIRRFFFRQKLEDLHTIYVTKEDYDKLMEMLDNPPPPSPELIKLLNRKSPWEK